MKKTFIIVLIAVFYFQAGAMTEYFAGDTLVNWAKGGLNIRMEGDLSSEKTGWIPYGEKVKVLETKYGVEEDELEIQLMPDWVDTTSGMAHYPGYYLTGKWVKITYGDCTGYVFDGYLSRYAAPVFAGNGDELALESIDDFLWHSFGGGVLSSKGDESLNLTKYKSGVVRKSALNDARYTKYVFPDFSLNEMMLLVCYGSLLKGERAAQWGVVFDGYSDITLARKLVVVPSVDADSEVRITTLNGVVILEIEEWGYFPENAHEFTQNIF